MYSSDLSDDQWNLIESILFEYYPPMTGKIPKGGRRMKWVMRDIIDAILYVIKTGCQWRMLPDEFPPWQSVYRHFRKLKKFGVWVKILEIVNRNVRQAAGRTATPTFGIIDAQAVKTIYCGPKRGFDGFKKTKGRKRNIVVDILGCLLAVTVESAGIHDTMLAGSVMQKAVDVYPSIEAFCGDSGYRGTATKAAQKLGRKMIISAGVKSKKDPSKPFPILPKRWIVERSFGWFCHNRRLAKDYEKLPENSETVCIISALRHGLNRLMCLNKSQ
mgnify:CR=1 FL=1